MVKKETTDRDVLRYMRRVLRKGWTQKARARDADGRSVNDHSRRAVSFSLHGAFLRAMIALKWSYRTELMAILRKECGDGHLKWFNDAPGRTKKEVIAVVDRAIELAA